MLQLFLVKPPLRCNNSKLSFIFLPSKQRALFKHSYLFPTFKQDYGDYEGRDIYHSKRISVYNGCTQNLKCVQLGSINLCYKLKSARRMYCNIQYIKIGQMHLPHTNFAVENILTFIFIYALTRIHFHPKFPIFCKHFK